MRILLASTKVQEEESSEQYTELEQESSETAVKQKKFLKVLYPNKNSYWLYIVMIAIFILFPLFNQNNNISDKNFAQKTKEESDRQSKETEDKKLIKEEFKRKQEFKRTQEQEEFKRKQQEFKRKQEFKRTQEQEEFKRKQEFKRTQEQQEFKRTQEQEEFQRRYEQQQEEFERKQQEFKRTQEQEEFQRRYEQQEEFERRRKAEERSRQQNTPSLAEIAIRKKIDSIIKIYNNLEDKRKIFIKTIWRLINKQQISQHGYAYHEINEKLLNYLKLLSEKELDIILKELSINNIY